MSSVTELLDWMDNMEVAFASLRFVDILGREQQIVLPRSAVTPALFTEGKMFDGSSILGFKSIEESDMVLVPETEGVVIDPFMEARTAMLRCNVHEPYTLAIFKRDPRAGIAKRAEAYLRATGIADTCFMGPEPEFFVFDHVRWHNDLHSAGYEVDSIEGAWNSATDYPQGNRGHRPGIKGGYMPVPPIDQGQALRNAMTLHLEQMGIMVEAHHHEVATGGQNEICTRFNSLVKKADESMLLKYVVHNTCEQWGKTATFMPKPIAGDNGNGMHCHQSLAKDGVNLFAGKAYAGLSELALHYIAGIMHHAKALNAFTNPTTNSYRRLVPGFEAPVLLAYSAINRSASIRVPAVSNPQASRIEVRFPDATANPYLAFSAMLMAGLDGIAKKMEPGTPVDHDLYHASHAELAKIPTVCASLEEALDALIQDHAFLCEGDVFTADFIQRYIAIKRTEATRINQAIHPLEFDMYYSW